MEDFLRRLIGSPRESALQKILLFPLSVLSFLYGMAMSVRAFLYRIGVFRSHSLSCRVISVGNLTLGGTGKTPFVQLVAEKLRREGYRTAVLSRGYKGAYEGTHATVSDGERILLDAFQAGDEPLLLARKLRGIPVIVGRQRRAAGQYAIDRFGAEVLVLDDGFQHLAIRRDVNLLLLDSSSPPDRARLFPRGELREPLGQLRRADALILTKGQRGVNIINLGKRFMNLSKDIPRFAVRYEPESILVWGQPETLSPRELERKKVLAFCGLAKPESFLKTLEGLRAEILLFERFPDHFSYGESDLRRIRDLAGRAGAGAIVTTEKDMVRLKDFPPGPIPLWALSVRHVFEGEDESRFEAFLLGRLGHKA